LGTDPTFLAIAGWASILALVLVLGGYARQVWQAYRKSRRDAESEFALLTSELAAAGGSVSSRTDVGFLVLLRLGLLRDRVASLRSVMTVSIVSMGIFFSAAWAIGPAPNLAWELRGVIAAAGFFLGVATVATFNMRRLQAYVADYADRVSGIWEQPVSKRAHNASSSPTSTP
jgi:hypothetical protein